MNILFIHQHYYPEMAGTARRTKELAEALIRRGFNCTVLTSFPREYRSVPRYQAFPFEIINDVAVRRINTFVYVKKNVITRLMSYLLFFLFTLGWVFKHRNEFDFVISVAPLSSGITGALIHRFLKIPHHFDVPDILPDLGIAAGMLKNPLLIKFLYLIEKWVYDNSSTISPITSGQVNNIVCKGVDSSKVFLIPDWVDEDFFRKNTSKYYAEIKEKINPDSKLKLVSFVGNIGALQGIETFIKVANEINKDNRWNYRFLFIGDGIMLPLLIETVKKERIANVEFIGRVPREHVPAYMAISDVLVANYVNNKYMEICIPGKTYEYIISRTPIVIGAKGEAACLVNKFGVGIAVDPSNDTQFKEAIVSIFENPDKFDSQIEEFSKKYNIESIVDIYEEVIKKNVGNFETTERNWCQWIRY